jgi:hypothetical protein
VIETPTGASDAAFVSRARPDDLVLFISDHGFQAVTRTVHMDRLLKRSRARGRDPGMPTGDEASSVSDTEADEMEEHLRGLGYLE